MYVDYRQVQVLGHSSLFLIHAYASAVMVQQPPGG